MNETSKLSIVVDVSNAQQKLKDFTRQLNEAKKAGDQLGSSASNSSQGLNNQAQSANKAQLEANKLAISNKKVEAQNNRTASSIYGLLSAENRAIQSQNNLQASAVKLVTAGKQQEMQNNRTASSAAQLVVSNQRIAITAEQLATAQFKTVTASNQAAASNNRLSVSANQVLISNNRLLTSAAQTAAAQTRETIATTNLARANWSLVTAATGAATAEQRLALQTSNAAAAALRAQREAVNLAAAQARLAAQADRAAGAMNGANAASRGLYGSMSKLYTLMNSGLAVVVGLGFIKDAAEMQNLNNQVRLVTTSEKEYLGVKQQINKIANTNYNSIAATTSLYQKSARALGNLGKTQQEALQFTNAISLAMRVGGRSAGEQAAALLQLGQAMGAGVIMGDEFRSISENAPILLDLVAKRMGVMKGELKALSAEGKITAEIMYDAVVENEEMLDKIAKGMPLTMGQAFIVASNKYREMVDTFMNGTGGLSDKISGLLVGISNNFTTIANTVKVAGVLAFVSFAGSVNIATAAMRVFNAVMGLNPLVRIAMLVLAVGTAFYGLNDVLDTTMLVFNDLMSVIGTGLNGLMDLAGAVAFNISQGFKDSANEGDAAYQGFFDNTEKGFAGFLQGTSRMIAAATSTLAGFFQWIGNGFWQALRVAGNAFIWLGNQAKSIVTKAGKTVTDLINEAINGINFLANKANAVLDNTPAPWRFKVIGEVEWRNPNYQDTPYFAISGKTLGENIGRNLDILMPAVDNYYSKLAARVKAGREKVDLSGDIGTGLIDPSSPAGMAAMKARQLAEETAKGKKDRKKALGEKKEKITPVPINSRVLGQAQTYKYAEIEAQYNIPAGLLAAVSMQESRGNPTIKSPAGAQGAFQFMPATAKRFQLADRTDVGASAVAAAKYLKWLINRFGSVDLALAGYNSGEGTVDNVISGKRKKLPKETRNYVPSVNAYWEYMKGGRDGSVNVGSNIAEEVKAAEALVKARKEFEQQFESVPQKILREADEKVSTIAKLFSGDDVLKYEGMVKAAAQRELLIHNRTLDEKLNASEKYRMSEIEAIDKERDDLVFAAITDPDLMRPENAKLQKEILDNIEKAHLYALDKNQLLADQKKDAIFDFAKTDKELFDQEWSYKIREASLINDEITQERLDALGAEYKMAWELFQNHERQKSLELRKDSMKQGEYLKQAQDIALQQIAIDPSMSPERKRLENNAARQPLNDAYQAISDELNPIDPMEKLKKDYEEKLSIVDAYESQWTSLLGVHSKERTDLMTAYERERAQLMLSQGQDLFGSLASASKTMLGEQSSTYRTMFGLQQSFVMASAGISMYKAISDMMAEGTTLTQKFAYAGVIASEFATIIGAVGAMQPKGFKSGGYTGNMGVNQVAGAVHGQEYVFDAKATREIGVNNLEALRSGKSIGGGDVNINVVVDAKGNAQVSGDNERMGRDMANGIKAVVMDTLRKEKRQGGMLYA